MRITKFGHACVRVETDGRVLVVDPGVWTGSAALLGADAVLVTHEHTDHVDPVRLAGLGIPVYLPDAAEWPVPDLAGRVELNRVSVGQEFTAAGFPVLALGGRHAHIHDGQPDCANLGYLVDGRLYHPGDSVHLPEEPVEVLCVPLQASWLKTAEAIDFVRAVDAPVSFGIHDGQVNEHGLASVNGWLGTTTTGYRYLAPGEDLDLG